MYKRTKKKKNRILSANKSYSMKDLTVGPSEIFWEEIRDKTEEDLNNFIVRGGSNILLHSTI